MDPHSIQYIQESCAYVTQKTDLLEGLSVESSLMYSAHLTLGSKVSNFSKVSRVKQVLADLALTQLANHSVETLTKAEYRRLVIGMQLVSKHEKFPDLWVNLYFLLGERPCSYSIR